MYGLVFAGGGVRGAYQIGVWKAINELKIKVSAVTGASIGAINAALFAQKSFRLADKLWRDISIGDVIALADDTGCSENLFDIKNLISLSKDFCKSGGFDMTPLRNLLNKIIDEDKIRKSPIMFGCTAYSLTEHSENNVFISDIPHGKLVDYLMASSGILSVRKISGESFTDGGASNNMPVDMLIEKGYTDIITVDVQGAGIYKSINTAGCNIIGIKCREAMTGLMDFNSEGIEKSIAQGYLDCMKVFGRLQGSNYYIKPFKTELSGEILSGIETAASAFGIDCLKAYTLDWLIAETMKAYKKADKSADGQKSKIPAIIIPWLVGRLEENNSDFAKNAMEIWGQNYDAAAAILYFKRKLK